MSTLTKKARLILLLALFLCGISFAALLGGLYYVLHLEDSLTQIHVDTKRGQDERQQLSALETLAKNTSAERARLASYIVPDPGFINFLALVESVARAHGVAPTTQTIIAAPIAGEALFEELDVNMSLSGSRSSIETVLEQYENLPYQVRIDHVTISTAGTQDAKADLAFTVTKMKP